MDNKKILMFLIIGIFMISMVSAFEFDNVIKYKNNDLDVDIVNAFGLGDTLGSAELKSHKTIGEILKTGYGGEFVTMDYNFKNWENNIEDLGEVTFTDMRTGKAIQKEYKFVEWADIQVPAYKEICDNQNNSCQLIQNGTKTDKGWVDYEGNKIKNTRIGIMVYVEEGEHIDGVWTIAGKKLKKHAEWQASLTVGNFAYYKLDDASGTVAKDEREFEDGYAVDGSRIFDGTAGKLGTAGDFNDTDTIFINNSMSGFIGSAQSGAVSLWFKPTNVAGNGYVWTHVTQGQDRMGVLISGGNTLTVGCLDEWRGTNVTINDNTWYHIVHIWDKGTTKCRTYVDTAIIQYNTYIPAEWGNNRSYIGSIETSGFFNGTVDELGFWNRTLTNTEISDLYNGGAGLSFPSFDTSPTVTLNEPTNLTTQNTNSVTFNCTASDDVNLVNVSLILDSAVNSTNSTDVINNSAFYFSKILSEGEHYWSCRGANNLTLVTTAEENLVYINFTLPTVTLSLPINNSNSSTSSIHFNATVWDDIAITNVSLIINGTINETDTSGLNNSLYDWDVGLEDGFYNWTVRAVDSYGNITTVGERLLNIDTTYPVVSASNLTDIVATLLPTNSTWVYTASDSNIDLCFYNSTASATQQIITCNSTITDLEWATGGNKTIQFCANDTFGFETCNTEYIWVYSLTETQADNPDPIGEGATATFNFTINLTDIATTTATLMINGSIYSPTTTVAGTNGYYFTKSLAIPDGWGNTTGYLHDWVWNYTIAGISTNASTTTENITVYEMAIDDCTTYAQQILNLSLRDEEGNSVIDGLVDNTTVEVDINLTSISDPSISIEYSNTFSNETNPQLCVPLNLINNTNYTIDITIGFDSTNRVWEFWHLDNGILNLAGNFNSYTSRNINLMDLLTADSTSFLFNYFNLNGQSVDGSIAHVFRKYIGEGLFREIERSKADQNGDTIVHLVEEDVIYYFMITLNGTILYTTSSYTALCQQVPCTINVEEGGESAEFETDWDLVDGGGYTINSSRSTRMVSLVYSVEDSATMNFTLYKYLSDGSYTQINTTEDTGTSGVLTLHVPQSAGNISFFSSVVKDNKFIHSRWIDFEGGAIDTFGTILSIFLGALLILTLGLMAISTGAGVLIWVMVGVFVSGALGMFATTLSTGVSVLIYLISAGALILWKITGGRK